MSVVVVLCDIKIYKKEKSERCFETDGEAGHDIRQ